MPIADHCNLRIPGPTPLPPEVREATSRQMINHRGAEFAALLHEVIAGLGPIFQTTGDILLFAASGTGGMEAAVANTVSPGDKVLAVSMGAFGDRFAEIAAAYGANIVRLSVPWGQAAEPEAVLRELRAHPDCRVLLVTQNETSTGVTNDIAAIGSALRTLGDHAPLFVVDAISALASIEMNMDGWGCDIVVAASQKGLMSPPGLALVAVGPRVWPYVERCKSPRFYFDFAAARRYLAEGSTPATPAVSLIYALHRALGLLAAEGLAQVYARHRYLAARTRRGLRDLGFRLFADERHASDSVTAAYLPAGVDGAAWFKQLRQEHGIVLGSGQGPLKGKIFRVAHMGYVTENDIAHVLVALQAMLHVSPPVA